MTKFTDIKRHIAAWAGFNQLVGNVLHESEISKHFYFLEFYCSLESV